MPRPRADDYDLDDEGERDDDRPRRRPKRESEGSSAAKVVLIIGGIILGVLLICGGIVTAIIITGINAANDMSKNMMSQMDKMQEQAQKEREAAERRQAELDKTDRGQAKKAAETWLKEVRDHHLGPAYQETTAAYRGRVTRAEFDALAARIDTVKWVFAHFNDDGPTTGTRFLFTVKLQGRGFLDVSLVLVKEGADWKVDDATVK